MFLNREINPERVSYLPKVSTLSIFLDPHLTRTERGNERSDSQAAAERATAKSILSTSRTRLAASTTKADAQGFPNEIPERGRTMHEEHGRGLPPGSGRNARRHGSSLIFPGMGQLGNSRATHRACLARDRDYTELTRRSRNSGRARSTGRGKKVHGDTGGFMLNGLDSGMRPLDGLPCLRIFSPWSIRSSSPSSSSRNGIIRRRRPPAPSARRILVALIVSSKNEGLIDEFRRCVVARK